MRKSRSTGNYHSRSAGRAWQCSSIDLDRAKNPRGFGESWTFRVFSECLRFAYNSRLSLFPIQGSELAADIESAASRLSVRGRILAADVMSRCGRVFGPRKMMRNTESGSLWSDRTGDLSEGEASKFSNPTLGNRPSHRRLRDREVEVSENLLFLRIFRRAGWRASR